MNIGKANLGRLLFEEVVDETNTNGGGASPTEPIQTPTPETTTEPTEPSEPIPAPQPEEDFETRFQNRFLEVAKERGVEAQSIDDVFKKPEPVVVEKNPYEKIDPKVKAFLDYHTETNRSFEDYMALQKDITTIPDIDLARERVRQETGQNLSNEEIDQYLEKKLNVDLSDLNELDVADKIELSAFVKSVRDAKIAEQQKYKQPIENKDSNNQPPVLDANMVQLESGEIMPKETYDKLVETRQKYVEGITKSVDNIAQSVFKVTIDDNGSEKTVEYGYDYSAEDKQKMVSYANDLEATITQLFKNEQNEFNHRDLTESMFWIDKNNREKAFAAMAHKIRAEVTESVLKEKGNINLGRNQDTPNIPRANNSSANNSGFGQKGGFGIKINIPNTNL
jgi:hypothetical protein